METLCDFRSEELGCLDPREMVEVGFGGDSDVASRTSVDASQRGSCTRGYVPRTARWVGAGVGLNFDCVGSVEGGSEEPGVESNSAGEEILLRNCSQKWQQRCCILGVGFPLAA